MLKFFLFPCFFLFCSIISAQAQLVTKKDYSAAFAIQTGGEGNLLIGMKPASFRVTPLAGLKMTFPINRQWFIGSEINYSQLKASGKEEDLKIHLNLKNIAVPVYVKRMLNSNRASVLLGAYLHYLTDSQLTFSSSGVSFPATDVYSLRDWNYGVIAGYEQQIIKHLNLTLKISCGMQSLGSTTLTSKKQIPLQTSLTLSFEIFRLGDCGCH